MEGRLLWLARIAGQRWWLMGVGSRRRSGHFPDQILIDPSARNKALLKHNPLSGISTADPVSEPRRPDLAKPTNGFYDIKPTDQISPRPILGDFDADLKDPFSGSLTIPNSTLLKSYLDEVITG